MHSSSDWFPGWCEASHSAPARTRSSTSSESLSRSDGTGENANSELAARLHDDENELGGVGGLLDDAAGAGADADADEDADEDLDDDVDDMVDDDEPATRIDRLRYI